MNCAFNNNRWTVFLLLFRKIYCHSILNKIWNVVVIFINPSHLIFCAIAYTDIWKSRVIPRTSQDTICHWNGISFLHMQISRSFTTCIIIRSKQITFYHISCTYHVSPLMCRNKSSTIYCYHVSILHEGSIHKTKCQSIYLITSIRNKNYCCPISI